MDWVSFPGLGIGKIYIQSQLFTIFGLNINFYAIIFSIAVLSGILFCYFNAYSLGVLKLKFVEIVTISFIFGMLGARIYYIIFNFKEFFHKSSFLENLFEIINLRTGGLAIYGGLIFSISAGVFLCKLNNIRVLPFLDLASFGFLLGQSVGRWGNFFNIEAYGTSTNLPWGMVSNRIDFANCSVHPTFLYESIWCFLGFILLNFFKKRRHFDGELFFLYFIWYSFERFFVEGLRADSLMFFQTSIRVSQMLSAVLFVTFIYLMKQFFNKFKQGKLKLYVNTNEWKEKLKLEEF